VSKVVYGTERLNMIKDFIVLFASNGIKVSQLTESLNLYCTKSKKDLTLPKNNNLPDMVRTGWCE
jgi:hypothetical protein